ncbi:MAG: TIGR03546 family protein [Gemmatimonadota bacterium]|nr:MAG: TIGR03546 family protein [Gemmatimonadota bacterium]
MYMILRLIQKLIATLNSDGTPQQVAAGMAIGTVFGLTPLINLHNLLILGIVMLFKVTIPAVMLGWFISIPLGFALDPLFDSVGQQLLDVLTLNPFWTAVTNAPVIAWANFNNSVVLGSLVFWMIAAFPLYLVLRWAVARYRETVYVRIQQMKVYRAIKASKLYNIYRLFRPE